MLIAAIVVLACGSIDQREFGGHTQPSRQSITAYRFPKIAHDSNQMRMLLSRNKRQAGGMGHNGGSIFRCFHELLAWISHRI